MYCKNCGSKMEKYSKICSECDIQEGIGNNYCYNCGEKIEQGKAYCSRCGFAAGKSSIQTDSTQRSKTVALLLAIFCGGLGIHSFYLGYFKIGLVQLLCSVLLSWTIVVPFIIWIWAIVQGVQAALGELKDADGNVLGS